MQGQDNLCLVRIPESSIDRRKIGYSGYRAGTLFLWCRPRYIDQRHKLRFRSLGYVGIVRRVGRDRLAYRWAHFDWADKFHHQDTAFHFGSDERSGQIGMNPNDTHH